MPVEKMARQQSASMEDYLERIAMLAEEQGVVRVTALSNSLGVKKPSVISALNKLSERGLVNHEKYGYVELTGEGKKVAVDILRRHEALGRLLVEILRVNPDTAWKDACDMEHYISPITVERLVKFVEFVLNRSGGRPEWLKGFDDHYLEQDGQGNDCTEGRQGGDN